MLSPLYEEVVDARPQDTSIPRGLGMHQRRLIGDDDEPSGDAEREEPMKSQTPSRFKNSRRAGANAFRGWGGPPFTGLGSRLDGRRPEPLDIVEIALFGREDVNDRVAEVDENPAAVGVAFHARTLPPSRSTASTMESAIARVWIFERPVTTTNVSAKIVRPLTSMRGEIFGLFVERGIAHDVDQFADAEISSTQGRHDAEVRAAASVGGASGLPLCDVVAHAVQQDVARRRVQIAQRRSPTAPRVRRSARPGSSESAR